MYLFTQQLLHSVQIRLTMCGFAFTRIVVKLSRLAKVVNAHDLWTMMMRKLCQFVLGHPRHPFMHSILSSYDILFMRVTV